MNKMLNHIIAIISAVIFIVLSYFYPAEIFLSFIIFISPGIPIFIILFLIVYFYNLYTIKSQISEKHI